MCKSRLESVAARAQITDFSHAKRKPPFMKATSSAKLDEIG